MGVLDKIKNALFEVEYVEVEEPEKKEKKSKSKSKEKTKEKVVSDKPIAKKVVLPEKKEGKVERLQEEDLMDDNFEVRPKDETIKQSNHDNFKFMDDNDFRVDDEYESDVPEILEVIDNSESERFDRREKVERRSEKHQIYENYSDEQTSNNDYDFVSKHPDKYYNKNNSKLYGMDKSYNVSVQEYGTYEKKEEKGYFKPSPIISPIYGILDKNYKKEDVVPKKEIRLSSSSFTRSNVSVDDIRNKAYGGGVSNLDKHEETTFEVDEEDDNLLVDLSDDSGKPEVKEVTMGDALEYFQDLGLEYNVDYVDATKERTTARRVRDNYDDIVGDVSEEVTPVVKEVVEEAESEKSKTSVVEVKDESNSDVNVNLDDDDNLFDLIDSMYQEEE